MPVGRYVCSCVYRYVPMYILWYICAFLTDANCFPLRLTGRHRRDVMTADDAMPASPIESSLEAEPDGDASDDQGSMLWSIFSAIFTTFVRKCFCTKMQFSWITMLRFSLCMHKLLYFMPKVPKFCKFSAKIFLNHNIDPSSMTARRVLERTG
jgi:hypothetical protein